MTIALMPYLLAVDGGGTGCRALLAESSGNIIGKGASGPANIGADTETALANIMEAATMAARSAGLGTSIWTGTNAALGLAGASSLYGRERLAAYLPFNRTNIVSDTITALLGAIGNSDGAMVIVGTGSAFIRQVNGMTETVGGRGFMLSDHAGGARLGRGLLEKALLAFDGMADRTDLVDTTMMRFGNDFRQIINFSRKATAADYAAFAPLVFEYAAMGDALALSLTKCACAHIRKGLDRLDVKALGRFSLTGGLADSYLTLPFLPYREFYTPPLGDALTGTLSLALAANWCE